MASLTISPEEEKRVKGLGFLSNKGTDNFSGRIITTNGKITAQQMAVIAQAAEKFGNGNVTLTVRMTIEVQGIPFDKIEEFREFIRQAGLETGGTGDKVRPVVSCKGTTCQFGLIDTFDLSEKVHKMFYEGYGSVKLPHKFKIAVGGCPNNCAKPDLNDVGIVGQRMPEFDESLCKGCKKCAIENNCPMHAAKVVDGKITIDKNICNNCGRCLGKCPFKAFESGQNGYKLYIGGRWGKKIAVGKPLNKLFGSEEEILQAVESALLLFKDLGNTKERFAELIDRIGFDKAEELITSGELLKRKDEILVK